MTHTITTGKMHGHPGACIAQYNHHILSHSAHHNPTYHNPTHYQTMPIIQQQITTYGHYWVPYWRPPVTSFPSFY